MNKNGKIYLKGQAMNKNIRAYIGGKKAEVYLIDEKTLLLKEGNYKGRKKVFLELVDSDEKPIYRSNTLDYKF